MALTALEFEIEQTSRSNPCLLLLRKKSTLLVWKDTEIQ